MYILNVNLIIGTINIGTIGISAQNIPTSFEINGSENLKTYRTKSAERIPVFNKE
jgi:hypothetical protein